jgi:hypothetical protein
MDATELAFAGIAKQAQLIAAGEVSSRELVDLYLQRIARLDGSLNAFRVVLAERALMEADQADARRGAGGARPLLGVPIAVKDNIDVAGELTCDGSNAHDEPARADAEVVRRLREAGAVIIGKTNQPAWSAPRSHPTAPGRSASPPPGVACSGSSPSAAGCRSRPTRATGTACPSAVCSRAGWSTPRCSATSPRVRAMSTSTAHRRPQRRSPQRPPRRREDCGSPTPRVFPPA